MVTKIVRYYGCGDCAKFFICTALGMKETGTFTSLPQELKVLSHHVSSPVSYSHSLSPHSLL